MTKPVVGVRYTLALVAVTSTVPVTGVSVPVVVTIPYPLVWSVTPRFLSAWTFCCVVRLDEVPVRTGTPLATFVGAAARFPRYNAGVGLGVVPWPQRIEPQNAAVRRNAAIYFFMSTNAFYFHGLRRGGCFVYLPVLLQRRRLFPQRCEFLLYRIQLVLWTCMNTMRNV